MMDWFIEHQRLLAIAGAVFLAIGGLIYAQGGHAVKGPPHRAVT